MNNGDTPYGEQFDRVTVELLTEVLTVFEQIARRHKIGGEVLFNPADLTEFYREAQIIAELAGMNLEQKRYAECYLGTVALLAHGMFALMTLRAAYEGEIVLNMLEVKGRV